MHHFTRSAALVAAIVVAIGFTEPSASADEVDAGLTPGFTQAENGSKVPSDQMKLAPGKAGMTLVPKYEGKVVLSADGFVKESAGTETVAPSSFAVDGNRIYLQNPINDSIALFVNGKPAGVAVEGLTQGAVDMATQGDKLFVLNNDNGVVSYSGESASGRRSKVSREIAVSHPSSATAKAASSDPIGAADWPASGLAVVGNELFTTFDDNTQVPVVDGAASPGSVPVVAGKGNAPAFPAFDLKLLDDSYRIGGFARAGEVVLPALNTPSGIFELARDSKHVYFEVAESYFQADYAERFVYYVYEYTYSGSLVATYALAPMLSAIPNRHVLVSDGEVYQLQVEGSVARVLRLAPSKKLTPLDPPAFSVQNALPAALSDGGSAHTAGSDVGYSDLVVGMGLANLQWTYTATYKSNGKTLGFNGWYPAGKHPLVASPSSVTQPHQLRGFAEGTKKSMVGVPYAWGGYDSKTTRSVGANHTNFLDAVSKKKFTGNIEKSSGYVGGTAGIDCSGLVSVIYKLGHKYGTTELKGPFNLKLNKDGTPAKPKGGDIRLKDGHVFVVAARRKKAANTYSLVVMESTTRNDVDRVIHVERDEGSYDNQFTTWYYPGFDYQCGIRNCNE